MESFRALSYHLIRQCFIHQERLGLPDSYYHKFMFALCGCSHNCACVSKLPPLIMLHPRTARRYAQIYAEFFIKNFCIQFFKVAREATVPAAPYYILTIVTEHFADADTLFRQKTVLAYTKHPHVSSPEAEPSGSLAHKVPKGVVS